MSRSNPELEHVVAEEALTPGVGDRLGEPFVAERELAAQVDEGLVAPDRVGGDRDALDELVRVALDEQPVLEGGGLALVTVDHEVARVGAGRQERPLLGGREAGATPPAQTRELHLLLHRRGVARREHLAQRVVGAGRERRADGPGVVGAVVDARGDDARLADRCRAHCAASDPLMVRATRLPDLYSSTRVSAPSGVRPSWYS